MPPYPRPAYLPGLHRTSAERNDAITETSLRNQVAVVTGASSGIGRATALALAREGMRLVLAARNVSALEETAMQVEAEGSEVLVVPSDVTEPEHVRRLVAEVIARWGRVEVLVANAGQYVRCPVADMTVADVERSMKVNFYGGVHAVLEVMPHMRRQGRGHIVLMSTVDARKGLPLDAPYVAAKFALTGFGDVLRQELHGTGIHVSTIFPGRVDTPMIESLRVPWISPKIPVEDVARATVKAIRRRRAEVVLPRRASVLLYLNTLSPRLGDWAVRFFHLQGWESESATSAP